MSKQAIAILGTGSVMGAGACFVAYLTFAWLFGVCSRACDYDDSCYQEVRGEGFVIKRRVGYLNFRDVGTGPTPADAWESARDECAIKR